MILQKTRELSLLIVLDWVKQLKIPLYELVERRNPLLTIYNLEIFALHISHYLLDMVKEYYG